MISAGHLNLLGFDTRFKKPYSGKTGPVNLLPIRILLDEEIVYGAPACFQHENNPSRHERFSPTRLPKNPAVKKIHGIFNSEYGSLPGFEARQSAVSEAGRIDTARFFRLH
jgi:hypothetical protein